MEPKSVYKFEIICYLIEIIGAPGRIRTPDPQIRSLVLYPAELPAPVVWNTLCFEGMTTGAFLMGQARECKSWVSIF